MSPPLNIKPNGAFIINGITSYATAAMGAGLEKAPYIRLFLRLETAATVPTHFFLAG